MSDFNDRKNSSHLYAGNAPFIEALYEAYLEDAEDPTIPLHWREYFKALKPEDALAPDVRHSEVQDRFRELAKQRGNGYGNGNGHGSGNGHRSRAAVSPKVQVVGKDLAQKQDAVSRLINMHRLMGHLRAQTDMIDLRKRPDVPALDPDYYGLTEADMDLHFNMGSLAGPKEASLRDILHTLRETYMGSIGTEFMHIPEPEHRHWLEEKLESCLATPEFSEEKKKRILNRLTAAEGMERYLHTKYAGQKRFSLEGGESFIPMLDAIILHAGRADVKEMVLSMAHRGRLNVLINSMGKSPKELFQGFEDSGEMVEGQQQGGDVKYHMGFSSDVDLPSGHMHLALSYNPSHLEVIDPVVQGSVRARQERWQDHQRNKIIALSVHGDAAFSGQGVVYETFNISQTRGFTTGGTIHVVINNRIGFTTSHPLDMRSTYYCTDIGKVCSAPIFHVNGNDPEAVVFVAELALEYRMKFNRDVIIDLVCYRAHGHNEADEPAATQPIMYQKIRQHAGAREDYTLQLIEDGVVTREEADEELNRYRDDLENDRNVTGFKPSSKSFPYRSDWNQFLGGSWKDPAPTAVATRTIMRLGERITTLPDSFVLHGRVQKIIDDRKCMVAGALPMDWGCAENLAYATLLEEGFPVRITGQDSGRGTFFHRHAVQHDQTTGDTYIPLQHLFNGQPQFEIVDSILSEEAVLGYEYGYSSNSPTTLVIWEAQFGDFVNGAQVLIDQFISSSEEKWNRLSGLVMMLPHGWEGQGPEHSSARLERFMQLCARENIQVCAPTTPAQMFHLLRRQMIRRHRKPLIIMSPKSMLRKKLSFTSLEDLSRSEFMNLIGEIDDVKPDGVRRVILCGGKVYYDLLEAAREGPREEVAILRVEQLYPFPKDLLAEQLKHYINCKEVVWCQEEPMNQGAWYHIIHNIRACMRFDQSLSYAGRLGSAAPSGGSYQQHVVRQKRLVEAAMNLKWDNHHPIIFYEPKQQAELDLF